MSNFFGRRMIKLKIELNKKMGVPYECVSFLEQFNIGQKVKFLYNGGMGGVYEVENIVNEVENPDFVVKKTNGKTFNATMADIAFITLLSDSENSK